MILKEFWILQFDFQYLEPMRMKKITPIKIIEINKNRFDIFMLFTRHPFINFLAKELHYYTNDSNTLLGVVILDYTDQDYNYILMARDENRQFRAFEIKTDYTTEEKCITALTNSMKWHSSQYLTIVEQGGPPKGLKLFEVNQPPEKLHPYFNNLKNNKGSKASKQAIIEISNHLDDIDGNFVEQFQSINGFDARLWELYLFASFIELEFEMLREFNRPDFLIKKDDLTIAVEAVILGRKNDPPKLVHIQPPSTTLQEIEEKLENETPLRYGSALYSKLKKEYWKLDHVKNKPLVFAIADFHSDASMIWSFVALTEYLYGHKQIIEKDENGKNIVKSVKANNYTKPSGEIIPTGFFDQPETENVSAILFSATGTLAKFTRMGMQAGFAEEGQIVMRIGDCVHKDPKSLEPMSFKYQVSEETKENWREGLNLFHNPKAKHPIDMEYFPNIGHHKFIDGELVSYTPDFHPYASMNYNTITK